MATIIDLFKHDKNLLQEVKVEKTNPQYAALMQEQLGGGNGELKAALQYMSQSFRIKDPERSRNQRFIYGYSCRGVKPYGNGSTNYQSTKWTWFKLRRCQRRWNWNTCTRWLSPVLMNSSGESWDAKYVTVTGDLVADLLSNIASEQRAKVVYEYLYRQIDDKYVRETIDFLLNREEAHNALFRDALNKVQNTGSNKDFGVTKDSKLYFDLSTPGPEHKSPNPTPPSFDSPNREQ